MLLVSMLVILSAIFTSPTASTTFCYLKHETSEMSRLCEEVRMSIEPRVSKLGYELRDSMLATLH